ncbi:MAG: aminotransferase class I/II-fold pyridoxal phosphate-dependent enzyme [Planctomycetes bacterium]|nr:aminotransferase class I/II-fold pyridoxal phosphate-dependent enzyme [Planctomycetota bacterium]
MSLRPPSDPGSSGCLLRKHPMTQSKQSPSARRGSLDLTTTSGTSPGAERPAGLPPDLGLPHGGLSLATLCAQAGRGERDGEPHFPAIVQSTTFARAGIESTAEHTYSRASNPTVSALERALARLEDAPHAIAFATGLAAETALFQAVCRAGDHVVCSRGLYGGTTRLFEQILSRAGVRASFVDTRDLAALRAALTPATRLLFLESPANPTLHLTDLAAAAALARASGAKVCVDNTFLTGALQRPLDLGADASVISTTKLVEGHSVALGGAVVTRDAALAEELRFVRKCTGAIQTPFHAWLTLLGLKTLPLRIARQSESAEHIATWLAERIGAERVHYPTFEDPALAARQHLGLHGNVLSFELEGGYERACAVLRNVRLCTLVEHVGSVETLLTHSASMTHGGVAPAARRAAGISEELLRLSVGLEDPRDVIADLDRALLASAKEVASCVPA